MLNEILQERVVSSRGRRNPRQVNRKMSNGPVRTPCEPEPKRIDYQKHITILK